MIPSAQTNCTKTTHKIRKEVKGVEGPVVGEEALQDLGADAESQCADEEGQVQGAAARGVEDPVEI